MVSIIVTMAAAAVGLAALAAMAKQAQRRPALQPVPVRSNPKDTPRRN